MDNDCFQAPKVTGYRTFEFRKKLMRDFKRKIQAKALRSPANRCWATHRKAKPTRDKTQSRKTNQPEFALYPPDSTYTLFLNQHPYI